MAEYVIWHRASCSTSRFVLSAMRDAGIAPELRDYVAQPPSPAELSAALTAAGLEARALLRRKERLAAELGLRDETDPAVLIAAMCAHPILIERPLVFGPQGAVLCRPKERIFDFLAAR